MQGPPNNPSNSSNASPSLQDEHQRRRQFSPLKALSYFFLLVMGMIFIATQVLNSRWFTGFLSQEINRYLKQQQRFQVQYRDLSISLFPPALVFGGVDLSTKNIIPELRSAHLQVETIKVEINLFTHTGLRYRIANVGLERGVLDLDLTDQLWLQKNQQPSLEWNKQLYTKLVSVLKTDVVEILRVALDHLTVRTPWAQLKVEHLSWEQNRGQLLVRHDLRDLTLNAAHLPPLKVWANAWPWLSENPIKLFKGSYALGLNSLQISKWVLEDRAQSTTLEVLCKSPFELEKSNCKGAIDQHQTALHPWLKHIPRANIDQLTLSAHHQFSGPLHRPQVSSEFNLQSINSAWVSASSIQLGVDWSRAGFVLKKFELTDQEEGSLKLLAPTPLRSWEKGFKEFTLSLMLKQLALHRALKVLPAVAKSFKAKVTGEMEVTLLKDQAWAEFMTAPNFDVQQGKLFTGKPTPLLEFAPFVLPSTLLRLDRQMAFSIDGFISFDPESYSPSAVKGIITGRTINLEAEPLELDLSQQKISLFPWSGKGKVKLEVTGPLKGPVFNFDLLEIKKFTLFGFGPLDLQGLITLDLERQQLQIERLTSLNSQTTVGNQLSAKGSIDLKSQQIDLKVQGKDYHWFNFIELHTPVLPYPEYFQRFTGQGLQFQYHFTQGLNLDLLHIEAQLKAPRLTLMQEDFFDLELVGQLHQGKFALSPMSLQVGRGKVQGQLEYSLKGKDLALKLRAEDLSWQDLKWYRQLNTSFRGLFNVELDLRSNRAAGEDLLVEGTLNSQQATLSGDPVSGPMLTYRQKNQLIEASGSLNGELLKASLVLDLAQSSQDETKKSQLKFSSRANSFGELLAFIAPIEATDPNFRGQVKLSGSSQFNLRRTAELNAQMVIEQLQWIHPQWGFGLNSQRSTPLSITQGKVRPWTLRLDGPMQNFVDLSASGQLGQALDVTTDALFNAQALSSFFASTLNVSGRIKATGSGHWDPIGNGVVTGYQLQLSSSDLSYTGSRLPMTFGPTDLALTLSQDGLTLNRCKMTLGQGYCQLQGSVLNRFPHFPVKLQYQCRDANVLLASGTQLTFAGIGALEGERLPYKLSGQYTLAKMNLFNEFEDLPFFKEAQKPKVKYLPKQNQRVSSGLLTLDLGVKSLSPIQVKNTLVDLALMTQLSVRGSSEDPILEGSVQLSSESKSKVMVNSNNFFLNRLHLHFDPKLPIDQAIADVEASGQINNYIVKAKVYGPLNRYQLDLTSEPSLPKQSILSLIVFGYAQDINSQLTEQERSSLSSVGVGSFIFNRLKLNQTLKENLGVTLNVGTAYINDQQSLLGGRTSQGQGTGRVRTATKVELNKQIDKKTNLSLSATVGASTGQRQEMNLNYRLNPKVSVEGVYEVNSGQTNNQTRVQSSVGSDVRFRWTFK